MRRSPPSSPPPAASPSARSWQRRAVRDVLLRVRDHRDLHDHADARSQVRDAGRGARHDQRRRCQLRHAGVLREDAGHSARAVRAASTGPAYVKLGGPSAQFFFEGTGNKVGAAYFVSTWRPTCRPSASPATAPTSSRATRRCIADVDDINNNVGFWAPQPDFRIPERLSPGFTNFPDIELEAIYQDQVETFVRYQTRIAERAILPESRRRPRDGLHRAARRLRPSVHADRSAGRRPIRATRTRSATTRIAPRWPATTATWSSPTSRPTEQWSGSARPAARSNVFVVSDHGMAPFHTAVSVTNMLRNAGVDTSQLAIRTSGAAVNIYVNLQGREAGGRSMPATYQLSWRRWRRR